jgi:putative endonuclease
MLVKSYYYVYFMTNPSHSVLYVGVTGNLNVRVFQHKYRVNEKSFTAKYQCNKLVYYETYDCIQYAIKREKQFKNWKRAWKDALILKGNPERIDLAASWFEDGEWDFLKKSIKRSI